LVTEPVVTGQHLHRTKQQRFGIVTAMIPQNFADAFERVKELVSNFRQNEERYLSPVYSEAQARLDFIDKFWIALGWDVAHENQTDPYKQEVKVERGVVTNEWRKRSDYAFLAPNFRDVRFYVEAKKPHVGLDNADYYRMLGYFEAKRRGRLWRKCVSGPFRFWERLLAEFQKES
jgi:hypothetical protein